MLAKRDSRTIAVDGQRYRWSVPEGYVMPYQMAPIAKPRDGLPVTLQRL